MLALQLLLALWLSCLLTSAWETLCPVADTCCLLKRLRISFSRVAKKSRSCPRDKALLSLSFAHLCTESAPTCHGAGQKTSRSWVSQSTLWILGTELRMSVLAASAFACSAISLAPDPLAYCVSLSEAWERMWQGSGLNGFSLKNF